MPQLKSRKAPCRIRRATSTSLTVRTTGSGKVSPDGIITDHSGNRQLRFSGQDGPAANAAVNPWSLAVDGSGTSTSLMRAATGLQDQFVGYLQSRGGHRFARRLCGDDGQLWRLGSGAPRASPIDAAESCIFADSTITASAR